MQRTMLKSKIHRASVTQTELEYEGSISIDKSLCEFADILQFEKVDVYNCNNGSRFSTYAIYGQKGEVCLNGAAARMAQNGDKIIIASYVNVDLQKQDEYTPKIVLVDKNNIPKLRED
jgi:aspartate 1-decarboxylase